MLIEIDKSMIEPMTCVGYKDREKIGRDNNA